MAYVIKLKHIGKRGIQGSAGQGVPTGGTAGQVLTKDSSTNFDTSWQSPGSGSGTVSSVFGRIGAVVAVSGDYVASQITSTPSGNIAATTVQAALNELDNEKIENELAIAYAVVLGG